MKIVSAFGFALACLAAAPAFAAEPPPQNTVINITVYGEDPCPASQGDDIVVCARRPESERYRIPKELRKEGQPTETAWGSRAIALDEVSATGRPDSCSVVGSYGQTGCFAEMLSRWRAERQAMKTNR
jgi:hypothetical protein